MRVDLGAGQHPYWSNRYWHPEGILTKDDWVTIDINQDHNPDILLDIGKQSLPFKDSSVEEIFAWHVLEHLDWRGVAHCLEEIYRILKWNGKFWGGVPNCLWALINHNIEPTARYNFEGTGGFGEDHHFIFTKGSLHEILKGFSFREIKIKYHNVLIPQYPRNSLQFWCSK